MPRCGVLQRASSAPLPLRSECLEIGPLASSVIVSSMCDVGGCVFVGGVERAKLLVVTVLGASLSVFPACRQPQADGRRRTEADPRTRADAIIAAHSCN